MYVWNGKGDLGASVLTRGVCRQPGVNTRIVVNDAVTYQIGLNNSIPLGRRPLNA